MSKYVNLKLRFKNPVFWIQIGAAVLIPIFSYFGLDGKDLTSWSVFFDLLEKALSNPYVLVLVIVSVWNALNDPTTIGLKDSDLVLKKGGLK